MRSLLAESTSQKDLLRLYLDEPEGQASQRALDALVQAAYPTIHRVLRQKMGIALRQEPTEARNREEQDASEVRSEVLVQVLAKLHRMKTDPAEPRIENFARFEAYVGITTYNAVSMHWRRKRPRRFSLENKVRHLLKTWPGLALWQTEAGEWLGGFANWQERPPATVEQPALKRILDNPVPTLTAHPPIARETHPARVVAALFDLIGSPLALDHLVTILAALWEVRDEETSAYTEDVLGRHEATESPERSAMGRAALPEYWKALQQLPSTQCAAILLDTEEMPEGRSIVDFLLQEGLTTPSRLAQAMNLPRETLAANWSALPLPDARIGEILGVKPQSVAKARMVARQHLARQFLSVA